MLKISFQKRYLGYALYAVPDTYMPIPYMCVTFLQEKYLCLKTQNVSDQVNKTFYLSKDWGT